MAEEDDRESAEADDSSPADEPVAGGDGGGVAGILSAGGEQILTYQTVPTHWQRWRGRLVAGGMLVGSHAVAAAFTFAVLMIGGGLLGVISGLMTIFRAPAGTDGPGALEALVGGVILGIFFALVGVLLAMVTTLAGITIDALRRPLRMPWWLALLVVACVLAFVCVTMALATDGASWNALLVGILWALVLAAIFCVYWIPMGCAEGILRGLKWMTCKLAGWHRSRKSGELAAATKS